MTDEVVVNPEVVTEIEVEEEEVELSEEEIQALPLEQKTGIIEALLVANGEPLSLERIAECSKLSDTDITECLTILRLRYDEELSGVELVCVAGEYQIRTRPRFAPFIRQLKATAPRRLSQAALETVSIIAYRQPIVKSDVEKIRGVDATPTIKTLLERGLIKIVGHQQTVGQPALYGTTDDFLKLFGLRSLEELPSLRDIKELEKDPGEAQDDSAPQAEASA